MTEFNDYQNWTTEVRAPFIDVDIPLRATFALGLNEEAGEIAGLIVKEQKDKRLILRDEMMAELGDALWYLSQTAYEFDISLQEVADYNIAKIRNRYSSKGVRAT